MASKQGSGRMITMAIATAIAGSCVAFMVLFVTGRESKAFKEVDRFVALHPRLVEALGSPVAAEDAVEEHYEKNPSVGFYSRIAATLRGSKGEAKAVIVLRKGTSVRAPWTVAECDVALPGGQEKLDVTLVEPPPLEPLKDEEGKAGDGAGAAPPAPGGAPAPAPAPAPEEPPAEAPAPTPDGAPGSDG